MLGHFDLLPPELWLIIWKLTRREFMIKVVKMQYKGLIFDTYVIRKLRMLKNAYEIKPIVDFNPRNNIRYFLIDFDTDQIQVRLSVVN